MRYTLVYVLLVGFVNVTLATPQSGDYLIIEGDTSYIYNILPSSGDSITRERYFEIFRSCFITSSYRGYQNFWKVENDSLFLVGLRNSCDRATGNIDDIKIFANWISEEIFIPKGEKLKYKHSGYGWYHEYELGIEINSGIIGESRKYDNRPNFYISPLEEKEALWDKYCDFLDDYDLNSTNAAFLERVIVVDLTTDKNGYIVDANILRSSNDDSLDRLAVDMIKSLARFSVYYRFGKPVSIGWTFPIRFGSILKYCK